MELANAEITAAVVTICGLLYQLNPDLPKNAKIGLPILIGALLGVFVLSDLSSIDLILNGLFTGVVSGIYGTGGVATAGALIKKTKSEVNIVEVPMEDYVDLDDLDGNTFTGTIEHEPQGPLTKLDV